MSSRMDTEQDLSMQLEVAEQEIKLMGLENIEYQNEINLLKQQNEGLLEESTLYFDTAQREQQQMMFLRAVSLNLDASTSHNDDLKFQISEYKTIAKDLETQNKHLQKKNAKYQLILEKIFQEKQTQIQLHNDHVTSLENKLQKLQNERDELRQQVTTWNVVRARRDSYASNTKQSPLSLRSPSEKSLFRYKRHSLQQNRIAEHMESEIKDSMADDDITSQLLQFGYEHDEIMMAVNAVNNKHDINEIVEHIDNRSNYCECEMDFAAQTDEINKLKALNHKHEAKIDALQRRIKQLRPPRNQRAQRTHNDDTCFSWSMNWFG